MLAALVVLALSGGFSQVGVLGQIFAGPPAPGVSSGEAYGGRAGTTVDSLPAIPVAALGVARSRPAAGRRGTGSGHGRAGVVAPVSSRGPSQTGGAVGGIAPIVSGGESGPGSTPSGSAPSGSAPSGSAPSGSAPSQPSAPPPAPSPKPTAVDWIVKTVTPVTQQLPAPAGPVATQAVQTAGSAADGLLPPGVAQAPAVPSGVKLP
jgi:hypothetical protein